MCHCEVNFLIYCGNLFNRTSIHEITTPPDVYSLDSRNDNVIQFNTKPQPSFNKQFDLLIENLNQNHNNGYVNYIACVSDQQAKRFHDIFEDVEQEVHYKTIVLSLYQGFIDDDNKIVK